MIRPSVLISRSINRPVAECGELLREGRVVFRLAGMKADVLEHDDLAVTHRLHGGLDRRPDAVVQMTHRVAHQLAQPLRERRRPVGLIHFAVRATKMRHQDHARAALGQVLDGRDCLADARIVDDPAALHWNVEIDADQHALTGDVDVADRGFL
jgi:hypothetical protein